LAAHRDPSLRWANAKLTTAITDEADAHRWLATQYDGWASRTRYSFAVLETEEASDDAALVGNVSIKGLTTDGASAEVGYWTSAFARGRGIAPRALDAVSRWAFALDRETPLNMS
jgi:RimJ/RimL family protein N-acetyltransferase